MISKQYHPLLETPPLEEVAFVVIHNDEGSMQPLEYVSWLSSRDPALGIAHYYINKDTIVRVLPPACMGYHTGDWWSNTRSIGYEVCQSLSASDAVFLENEDRALMQATEDLLAYGLPISHETVRLHHEFVDTSCPHRSLALHGGTTESVKTYFVERMQFFARLGTSVEEMMRQVSKPAASVEPCHALQEIAHQVIQGEWGNGEERRLRLSEQGYDYEAVQQLVNQLLE